MFIAQQAFVLDFSFEPILTLFVEEGISIFD